MKLAKLIFTTVSLCHLSFTAHAMDEFDVDLAEHVKKAAAMLRNLREDNNEFVKRHAETGHFDAFMNSQDPRVTFVSCADSRVHTHAFDVTPDNDIFMVRNLSGQFKSSDGDISYGVKHAHTPLLCIVGHDDCGAVKAKTQLEWIRINGLPSDRDDLKDLSHLETEIITQLSNVHIARAAIPPKSDSTNYANELKRFNYVVHENIKFNTHRQVDSATEKFLEKIKESELIVAGGLYDFQGREGQGKGRLIWTDARNKEWYDARKKASTPIDLTSVLRVFNGKPVLDSQEIPTDDPEETGPTYVVRKDIKSSTSQLKRLEQSMPYAGPHHKHESKL